MVTTHVCTGNEEGGIALGDCPCKFFHQSVLGVEGPQCIGVVSIGSRVHHSRSTLTAEIVGTVGGDEVCGLSVGVGGFHKSPCDGSPVHEVVTA